MELLEKIRNKEARIGVIGLGYVGLPLVIRFCEVGYRVIGFDIDPAKVTRLNKGESYIKHIRAEQIQTLLARGAFSATSDMQRLKEADAVIICVPTPLTDNREPDMQYVQETAEQIVASLRPGQIISLESTTYPGTTEELLLPLFAKTGLRVGKDFFLVFSPEREDPGRVDFTTKSTPKIVGGATPRCLEIGQALYSNIVDRVVAVSSTKTAEMVKLLENIYRSVNISLVNELKIVCDRMNINIWEVIEAAKTKPFGFQAFYPGPGLGGHCIPIDPFYLTWKAREYDLSTRFIELAGEIGAQMPYYVVQKIMDALNDRGKSMKGSKILVLGIAYKKDVDDMRESPALKIIELLLEKGSLTDYHDPFIPEMPRTRHYAFAMKSAPLTEKTLKSYDCILIATDHSSLQYDWVVQNSSLVVDTRNAVKTPSDKVVKA
jgi:UDP-N-acetyl-D-glucosamine dehydrogenase